MRKERLKEIKALISSNKLSDQDTLLELLKERNYELTQATLSRDLKYLKIAKVFDEEGDFIYALPNELKKYDKKITAFTGSLSGFLSMDFTGNLAVIRTLPGHANQVALYIDYKECPVILGTIAGDDTIFIAIKEENRKEDLIECMLVHFPELEGRF